jgi:hypothetical protein
VAGDSDVVGLERHRRRGELSQPAADPGDQISLRLNHLDVRERPRRLDVAAVRGQNEPVAADEQRRVRALEAREVADIDRPGDEEARRAEPVQLGPEPRDALAQLCSLR